MFTPQEVSEKVFPKASGFGNGYQMSAVDEFLDTLTEDYTGLFKENVTLKTKLKVLAEKVEEYRSTEDAMRSTLLTAQKMAAKLVQEAQTEKDQILAEARAEAAGEIARLDAEKKAAEDKLAAAQQSLAEFIERSRSLCEQQAAFLSTLPELEMPQTVEEPAQQEEAIPQEAPALEDIEQVIRKTYEEVADEPAVDDAPTQKVPAGSAIPSDFKLSLEELKFGRNYGSNN